MRGVTASRTTAFLYLNHTENTYRVSTSASSGSYFIGPNCGSSSTLTVEDSDLWWRTGGCSGAVAKAVYDPSILQTGWDELAVTTSARFDDRAQAYAAGYIEGYITHDRIFSIITTMVRKKAKDAAFISFLTRQDAYLRSQVTAFAPANDKDPGTPSEDQSFWYHVGLVLQQLDGMLAGYNARASARRQITLNELWQINDDGDKIDIDRALAVAAKTAAAASNSSSASLSIGSKVAAIAAKARFAEKRSEDMSKEEIMELIAFNGHCTALVKFTGDDVLVGHNTWSDFDMLLRMYKSYDHSFHHPATKSQGVTMSSYPGFIWSSDDFYTTSRGSQLVLTETTITILDESLFDQHVSPENGVMSWIRTLVAIRRSASGKEFTEHFRKYNSGTYNNAWLVVDMALVNQAKKLPKIAATTTTTTPTPDATTTAAASTTANATSSESSLPVAASQVEHRANIVRHRISKATQAILAPMAVFGPPKAVASASTTAKSTAPSTTPLPGLALLPGTFYLLEQIPGFSESRDLTDVLQMTGYFGGYNLPYFASIAQKAFYEKLAVELDTPSLNYFTAHRAQILRRDHARVKTVADMQTLLRANDYQRADSLTGGCPNQAVAARYDIAPLKDAKCDVKTLRLNGAIDAKVTSGDMITRREMSLISGPTYNANIPPFDWSRVSSEIPQAERQRMQSEGVPMKYTFPWKLFTPTDIPKLVNKQPKESPFIKRRPFIPSRQQMIKRRVMMPPGLALVK